MNASHAQTGSWLGRGWIAQVSACGRFVRIRHQRRRIGRKSVANRFPRLRLERTVLYIQNGASDPLAKTPEEPQIAFLGINESVKKMVLIR